MKLASHMRPTCGFSDHTFLIQSIESGECIGLQCALELCQMIGWVLALAIWRIREPNRRCLCAARRPIVTNIGPQTPDFRFAVSWRKHRNGNVVAVQFLRGQYISAQSIDERLKCLAGTANPIR